MIALEERFVEQLDTIAAHIQNSELLALYLEEEEDESYKSLCDSFEPYLAQAYGMVAEEAPLQLVSMEKMLLEDRFEGLFLPRVLGYSVLREEINETFRYVRPNNHFKEILLEICNSVHFEQIKKRIGQTVKVGFALSSDIWITNLMSQIGNRRIRNFLQAQRSDLLLRDEKARSVLFNRYNQQFKDEFFHSADFPSTLGELKANFSALRLFLEKRFEHGGDNASLNQKIKLFLDNSAFHKTDEYAQVLVLYGNFIVMDAEDKKVFSSHFERERKTFSEFPKRYLEVLLELLQSTLKMTADHDLRMDAVVDKAKNDRISDYYRIVSKVHSLGYVHPDAIESVKDFYDSHNGTAIETDCLRHVIYNYFDRLLAGLNTGEYTDFFEFVKIFNVYMNIFGNEQFNFSVEKISLAYVKKLMVRYTDKRSRDYQDIKKFVASTFVEMGFLTDKEVVAMFKTRRRRKKEDGAA